jgi:hypothetical protein
MLKFRSVTGTDGTIWESVREDEVDGNGATPPGEPPPRVRVTFSSSLREVAVTLPRTWPDAGAWPDWVIVGEIERSLAAK